MKYLYLGLFVCFFSVSSHAQNMNNQRLGELLHEVTDSIQGTSGAWEFIIHDRVMLILTDENYNRMRIITPIIEVAKIGPDEIKKALTANFHTALDAKYAISEDIMWSTFIHPLKELSDEQFKDAIRQVYNAAQTFGTLYTSTELSFPGSDSDNNQKPEEPKKKTKKI